MSSFALAHLAEVDARRLYARTCTSMFEYCVRKLGFSEDVAAQRIHAARTARSFPAIFAALAEGRLHPAGVRLLAPVLNEDNAAELLARGGLTTASNIRLLCRTHNQYEAERALGAGFMNGKRALSRRRIEAKEGVESTGNARSAPALDTRPGRP